MEDNLKNLSLEQRIWKALYDDPLLIRNPALLAAAPYKVHLSETPREGATQVLTQEGVELVRNAWESSLKTHTSAIKTGSNNPNADYQSRFMGFRMLWTAAFMLDFAQKKGKGVQYLSILQDAASSVFPVGRRPTSKDMYYGRWVVKEQTGVWDKRRKLPPEGRIDYWNGVVEKGRKALDGQWEIKSKKVKGQREFVDTATEVSVKDSVVELRIALAEIKGSMKGIATASHVGRVEKEIKEHIKRLEALLVALTKNLVRTDEVLKENKDFSPAVEGTEILPVGSKHAICEQLELICEGVTTVKLQGS